MVRKLLATTALVTLITGAAYAQETTTTQPAPVAPAEQAAPGTVATPASGFLASNLIGETVYNGTGDNAENIGKVNDVVIGADGNVEQVVVGVGGFLGIGEKNVALDYKEISWAERDGDRWIVVNATKDQLQAQADFDRKMYDPAPATSTAMAPADTNAMAPAENNAMAPAAPATDTTAAAPAAPATDTTAAAPAATTDTTQTAAIDRSTLTEMPAGDIRAEDLVGTTVYGANDANVGEIGDVVLTQDGKVDAVIIDVGGFLGIGEKEVAVGMDKLAFMTDADGNKYLYTNFTKEQLEAQTAYDKSSWADNRDKQRMMMQ
jgi:sporulation protein YlmC with PRC-barrel domain